MRPRDQAALAVRFLVVSAALACAPRSAAPPSDRARLASPTLPSTLTLPSRTVADEVSGRWASDSRSPQPGAAAIEPELTSRCGLPDRAVAAAAQHLAEAHARGDGDGDGDLDTARVAFELRVTGSPYAWPRVWSLTGAELDSATVTPLFTRWLSSFDDGGERRCGMGLAVARNGERHLIALAADVLADLEPLPVRARTGAWLRLVAAVHVPATAAKVVLLGPRGRPRRIPTELTAGRATATFALAEPGQWLVQLVVDTTTGPRPVLEALVHADTAPPEEYVAVPTPGEGVGRSLAEPSRALLSMLNAARASEGLGALGVDRELTAIAAAHAEAMRAARRLGHDVGQGDLPARLDAAGVSVHVGGENVARASNAARGHRAIWQSPSHRDTLLDPRYDSVGVGAAEDPDGSLWLCEILADR